MKKYLYATLFLTVSLSGFAQTGSAYVEIETRSLEELYQAALEEGGEFVLRAGGDKSDQIDYYLDMFKARFPKLKVTHTVDVSINHAPRYDNARAAGGQENIPDVIQFQTLHRFTYYTEQGYLDIYKPKNWDKVFPDYKDPHGHWTGLYGVTFSNYVNTDMIPADQAPRDAMDYLDPALKGKVILKPIAIFHFRTDLKTLLITPGTLATAAPPRRRIRPTSTPRTASTPSS